MLRRSLLVTCLCALLGVSAGCAKKAPAAAPAPPPPSAAATPAKPPPPSSPPPPPPAAPAAPKPLTDEEVFSRKSLGELSAELSAAFFDYDQSTLREDARPVLQKNVAWLKRWTSTRVTIEGHCDSRGSSEYNLALGERRAAAVKDYLVNLGVAGDRILTVTKGKEQPFCRDETEGCWAQNRRGHFVVTAR